jgi:hypothetical protein
MRRGFSIFLIMLFGLGPLSSLIDGSEDANLPACCRRHGAHHCVVAAMAAQALSGKTATVSAPMTCPSYPGTVALLSTVKQALASTPQAGEALRPFEYVQVAAHASPRSNPAQSHAGRSPPASSLG